MAAAIKGTAVPRPDVFLTTKVPCCPGAWGTDCKNPEFDRGVANIARDVALLGPVRMHTHRSRNPTVRDDAGGLGLRPRARIPIIGMVPPH